MFDVFVFGAVALFVFGAATLALPRKCQQKVCKGDQNCQVQAMVADFTGDPYDEEKYAPSSDKDKYDPLDSWTVDSCPHPVMVDSC